MAYEPYIGIRYLLARGVDTVSIVTLICVCGVSVGVMAMIVVLSVMGGFEGDLKTKILGTKTHVVVHGEDWDRVDNVDALLTSIRGVEGVVGAAPYIETEVMISSPTNLSGVVIKGIDPESVGSVSDLERNLVDGDLAYLDSPKRVRAGLRGLSDPEELDRILDELEFERNLEPVKGDNRDGRYQPGVEGKVYNAPDGQIVIDQGAREDFRRKFIMSPSKAADGANLGKSVGEHVGEIELPTEEAGKAPPAAGDAYGDDPPEGFMPALPGQVAPATDHGYAEDPPEGFMPSLPGQGEPAEKLAKLPGVAKAAGDVKSTMGGPTMAPRKAVPGIIIGRELKKSLQVDIGSEVNVVAPKGDVGPSGPIPRSRPFKVVGIFYSGMYEYDTKYVYLSIPAARDFLNMPDGTVTGIEVKTADVEEVKRYRDATRAQLDKAGLGQGLVIEDWQDLNKSLFLALELEKWVMFIILLGIVVVAGFSILCNLVMMVMEKAREVAILKSLGATGGGVLRIFVIQGSLIGAFGTVLGALLGVLACLFIEFYGIGLDPDVYYISHLPVEMDPVLILTIAVASVVVSTVATLYPAALAYRLMPVEGLRLE
jgi:lipoprotein-releasing system permease protein